MPTPDQLWIAVAVVLFVGLVAALAGHRPLPKVGRRCRRCGYDLAGTPDSRRRCPECGGSLAGGVVEGVSSEFGARWRHRWRRLGLGGIGLAILIALAAVGIDPRRLARTPTWVLAIIDAPIACRLPDDRSPWATAVFDTLADRATSGTAVDTDLVRRVVDPLLPRLDGPDRVPMGARRFVLFAWGVGVVRDAELASIESIWPAPLLAANAPPSVDGLDLSMVWKSPFDAAYAWPDLAVQMVGREWTAEVGDVTHSETRAAATTGPWPRIVDPNRRTAVGLLNPGPHPLDLEPGEIEVVVRRRFVLEATRMTSKTTRVVGEREVEFSARFTIPDPAPLPELVPDAARLSAVARQLEEASWAERIGPGVFTITIATRDPSNLDLATPTFACRVNQDANDPEWEPFDLPAFPELDDTRLGPALARRAVKRPVGGRLVRVVRTAMFASFDADDDATTMRIRLDTTALDPRLWRRLIAGTAEVAIPETLPAGMIEFDIPIIEADS